jgi:hypothetical protein
VQLQVSNEKLAFGCGFCIFSIEGFKPWTIHLAHHYSSENVTNRDWNHSKMIMGLLKHPDVEASWTALMEGCGYGHEPTHWPEFTWDKQVSRPIVDRLQYKSYQVDLQYLLQQLYEKATPPKDYVRPNSIRALFGQSSQYWNSADFWQISFIGCLMSYGTNGFILYAMRILSSNLYAVITLQGEQRTSFFHFLSDKLPLLMNVRVELSCVCRKWSLESPETILESKIHTWAILRRRRGFQGIAGVSSSTWYHQFSSLSSVGGTIQFTPADAVCV